MNKIERDLESVYDDLQALVARMVDYNVDEDAVDYVRDAIINLDRLCDYLNGWDVT